MATKAPAERHDSPRTNDSTRSLNGVRVAILATDGFEQIELVEPRRALELAGAEIELVSIKTGRIQGWNHQPMWFAAKK